MIIGKVVGSVVSTRKCDNLVGNKFMIVEPIPSLKVDNRIVAIDKIGARGSANTFLSRKGAPPAWAAAYPMRPVDAAIVGILDEGQNLE